MAEFQRGDATIHYVTTGDPDGFPVLLIAPGGLQSSLSRWEGAPYDPMARLRDYRVIAMDQRNAGRSRGPVLPDHGWDTYTGDQLALLDHLGVHAFHVLGMCIGGPYVMGLIRAAPDRVRSAVMLQPIGLDDNRHAFLTLFDAWSASIAAEHPEADEATWAAFRHAMFGGSFLFNASRDDVAACATPILLLKGDDLYHPASISDAVASLAPNLTYVERWKDDVDAADRAIRSFLGSHTPESG